MTTEKHLALELVAALADRFGPGSKVAKESAGLDRIPDRHRNARNGRESGQGPHGGGECAVF